MRPVDGSITRSGLVTLMLRRRRRRRRRRPAPRHRRRPRATSRVDRRAPACRVRRPWKTGMAHVAVGRPFGERTSATSSGLTQRSPPGGAPRPAAGLDRLGVERRLVDLELDQARVQVAPGLARPSRCRRCRRSAARRPRGSRAAGRRPRRAAPLRSVKPQIDELLAQRALELQPGLGARRDVGRVGALER